MRQQGFGRIINTSSVAGIFGNFGQANYSAAKLAIHGLTNTLAKEGESKNILVNTIAPVAATRMTQGVLQSNILDSVNVEYIVPIVEWLAHPDSNVNGQLFEVGGGWVANLRWQRSKGASFDYPMKAEDVRNRFEEVSNFDQEPEYPENGNSSVAKMFENFERNQKRLQANKTDAKSLKSTPIFNLMDEYQQVEGEKNVKICDAVYNFEITKTKGGPVEQCWVIDLKNGKGSVKAGRVKDAAATFTMTDDDYCQIVDGKLNPQMAFLQVCKELTLGQNEDKRQHEESNSLHPRAVPKAYSRELG